MQINIDFYARERRGSGEHRLPACSAGQLALRFRIAFTQSAAKMFVASCRELQASSLCSPEKKTPPLYSSALFQQITN
jgi:hypothetical protein